MTHDFIVTGESNIISYFGFIFEFLFHFIKNILFRAQNIFQFSLSLKKINATFPISIMPFSNHLK